MRKEKIKIATVGNVCAQANQPAALDRCVEETQSKLNAVVQCGDKDGLIQLNPKRWFSLKRHLPALTANYTK